MNRHCADNPRGGERQSSLVRAHAGAVRAQPDRRARENFNSAESATVVGTTIHNEWLAIHENKLRWDV